MIKHAYILEARGHPGHDVIRNFYQSQGLEDGKIYNKQGCCVGDDQMVTRMVQNHEGQEIEQKGWQGGDGENTVNLKQIIQATYATMVSRFLILRGEGHKFTPGVATMWARGEFGQNFDSGNVNTFNESLNLLVKFHSKDYDKFLRNIANGDTDTPSADEIIERFNKVRSENIQGVKDRINAKEYTNTKYFIKPITKYNDLLKYKPFCYSKNVWCLMNGKAAWDSYTSNGTNQFYLVLDKRLCDESGNPILENKDIIPVEEGENHPNDEYGLSMIGIIVDQDGELSYCTSRWNHAGKGSDHTMNVEEISNTLGVNFYQTFKPNHKFQDKVDKAMAIYHKNGKLTGFKNSYRSSNKKDLFIVKILNKQNFLNIKTGKLISKKWFDNVDGYFINDLARIEIENKGWNFINTNGEIMSKYWFDATYSETNDFNRVYKNGKFNFVDKNFNLISDTWFKNTKPFNNGIGGVFIKNKGWNFINGNGEILSNIWYKNVAIFKNFMIALVDDNKNCMILENPSGKQIYDTIFTIKQVYDEYEGLGSIELNGKYNLINRYGKLVSSIWFDEVGNIFSFKTVVKIEGDKSYYINNKGNLYDIKTMSFIRNVSPQQNDEDIANESLIRKYANEFNEVLDLNNRIKKLYK